ncbi:hypothetical protein LTX96_0004046 [Nakaseomyces glabratus]|nr:hypothetical protein LTX96_0004046 [Nakaseomyces glabratus]
MDISVPESQVYADITGFIGQQQRELTNINEYLDDSDAVPIEVQELVELGYRNKLRSKTRTTATDLLVKNVYELENEWKLRTMTEMMDIIGDIPKHSIGSELRESIEDPAGHSHNAAIDDLIEDILKLPLLQLADTAHEDDDNAQLLREYRNLKNDVINKCNEIVASRQELRDMDINLEPVRSLLKAIPHSSEGDIRQYFIDYQGQLESVVKELSLVVEEAYKQSENDPIMRGKLADIINNM